MKGPIDINKEGNAYTVISWDYPTPIIERKSRLSRILEDGLLGAPSGSNFGQEFTREAYEQNLHDRLKLCVHFNIIGRTNHYDFKNLDYARSITSLQKEDLKMADNPLFKRNYRHIGPVGVLFDLASFKETSPYCPHGIGNLPVEDDGAHESYSAYCPKAVIEKEGEFYVIGRDIRDFLTEEGTLEAGYENYLLPLVEYDHGFLISPNVPRENLTGIIVNPSTETLRNKVEGISREMLDVHGENSDLLLPIYDLEGNMHWPEKIPYEKLQV